MGGGGGLAHALTVLPILPPHVSHSLGLTLRTEKSCTMDQSKEDLIAAIAPLVIDLVYRSFLFPCLQPRAPTHACSSMLRPVEWETRDTALALAPPPALM